MAISRTALQTRLLQLVRQRETMRLAVIGVFALTALILTTFTIEMRGTPVSSQIYPLVPHLYLIPIILLALWYPRRGLQVTILIIAAVVILIGGASLAGMVIDPVLSLLNAGMDIAIFVVLALYAKDRTLVESVIRGFLQRYGESGGVDIGSAQGAPQIQRDLSVAISTLVSALGSGNEDAREEAARELGQLHDPRTIAPLTEALGDESRFVRRAAARALGRTGDPRAVSPLLSALRDDDRATREGAAEGLADLGPLGVPALIEAARDPEWRVRVGAVVAIRIGGDRRAIVSLIEAASDSNVFVRREAVKGLGRIGDERGFDCLLGALTDEDHTVRLRAVGALSRCERGDAIEGLKAALWDEDGAVRLRAAQVLEGMKDPRARQVLREGMRTGALSQRER
ncbi:MAG: HEAT repeat domain-containing protein [Methanomicrobiales archaeon]|nr:HEAT repeat domain-containing protein [Methanomicrobiales archaeon]